MSTQHEEIGTGTTSGRITSSDITSNGIAGRAEGMGRQDTVQRDMGLRDLRALQADLAAFHAGAGRGPVGPAIEQIPATETTGGLSGADGAAGITGGPTDLDSRERAARSLGYRRQNIRQGAMIGALLIAVLLLQEPWNDGAAGWWIVAASLALPLALMFAATAVLLGRSRRADGMAVAPAPIVSGMDAEGRRAVRRAFATGVPATEPLARRATLEIARATVIGFLPRSVLLGVLVIMEVLFAAVTASAVGALLWALLAGLTVAQLIGGVARLQRSHRYLQVAGWLPDER
ncbi:hypothetical protein GIS00_10460 [Nakamurella sp. YIM 132087]|uniref:Uncharacterized protein n=1 Tax=Nakamurella alba TaxID=2665158 RepID=A0A7K1FJQ7_9ACTN|nr:hypothetical protein [Nakamurella alba]MTD14371.1 hypothetical protein [Nakamurella alba]